MNTEKIDDVGDIDPVAQEAEIDISDIPEESRDYIDPEKYEKNRDTYKQAFELGWKPKELWVAAGKAEEDHFSPGAFLKQRAEINRNHEMAKEIRETRDMQRALLATIEETKQAAFNAGIAQREAELARAVEAGDAQRAVQLTREIDASRAVAQQATGRVTQTAEQIIDGVRKQNPLIDKSSPSYDADADFMFEAAARAKGNALMAATGAQKLSEAEFNKILSEASTMVKSKIAPSVQQAAKPVVKAPTVSSAAPKKNTAAPKLTARDYEMIDSLKRLPNGELMAKNYINKRTNNI